MRWLAETLKKIEGIQVHAVEGRVRELWRLVSARHQLQRKRIALINTIRGYV